MSVNENSKLTRIGVFYDGNYFLHVSNYYNYFHDRRARISISGLHLFIRNYIAKQQNTPVNLCQIADAHYFRGRLNAKDSTQQGNQLFYERIFDDVLSSQGVTTHYLPVKNYDGVRVEKGIDVWLALEAFELAFYKKFDVLVLISADGDYAPLIRKLNTLGTRVMVLSWDFSYTNSNGREMVTKTALDLLEEVTYPVAMHEIIENGLREDLPQIRDLFVVPSQRSYERQPVYSREESDSDDYLEDDEAHTGTILSLKNGFGFIKFPPNNLFFHHASLSNVDFNDLHVDDEVSFTISRNDRGEDIATDITLLDNESFRNSLY